MGVTPDGQAIIGGGFSHNVSGNTSTGVVLVAINSTSGQDNATFGNDSGIELDSTSGVSLSLGGSLVVTSGGQTVVGSNSNGGLGVSTGFYLKEYNANGTLNTSFGSGGVASVSVSDYELQTIGMEADGQIVAGGAGYPGTRSARRQQHSTRLGSGPKSVMSNGRTSTSWSSRAGSGAEEKEIDERVSALYGLWE